MKENPTENKEKISKFKEQFLKLIQEDQDALFEALSYKDIIKPLIWKDSCSNGGKLGYRGIAMKYNISEMTARTLLKNIKKNIDNG